MRSRGAGTARLLAALMPVALTATFIGCATSTPAELMQSAPDASAIRQQQTRRFEGIDETELLSACVGVLQDLGFTIKLSDAKLGFARGVKDREAKAPEQAAAVTLVYLLLVAAGGGAGAPPPMHQDQTIGALVVVQPAAGNRAQTHDVRVSFHRFMRQPLFWEAGSLRDPELYNAFFDVLSKAIFLEAHKL